LRDSRYGLRGNIATVPVADSLRDP